MSNTGYKGYSKLLKITDDGTERALDINGDLCSESGLPQDFKNNISSDPDYVAPVLDESSCPISVDYCVTWEAANEGNIKMSTNGFIDFTAMLMGRTINTGASAGTVTGYIISGEGTFSCEIPMTFTTSQAQWDTDTLPVIVDKVLTSLIYTVNIIFNNATEFDIIDGQTNAVVIPDPQLSSSYTDC